MDLARKRERRWREKFAEAFNGIRLGIRDHSSFFVHIFFAVLVVTFAVVLDCLLWEWCLLIGCIGMVLSAELFNSALETLFHGLDDATKGRIQGCLDIAAGGVLMASIAASIIGILIFGQRVVMLLNGGGTG